MGEQHLLNLSLYGPNVLSFESVGDNKNWARVFGG